MSECVLESPEITKGDFGVLQLLQCDRTEKGVCRSGLRSHWKGVCAGLVYEPVCAHGMCITRG